MTFIITSPHRQGRFQSFLTSVIQTLRTTAQLRMERRRQKAELEALLAIDPRILEDMGVSRPEEQHHPIASLAQFNPAVVAVNLLTGTTRRHH